MRHHLIDQAIEFLKGGQWVGLGPEAIATIDELRTGLLEYREWAENLRSGNQDYAEENTQLRRELATGGGTPQRDVRAEAIAAIRGILPAEPGREERLKAIAVIASIAMQEPLRPQIEEIMSLKADGPVDDSWPLKFGSAR